jgi:hypothetical protein
MEDAQLPVQLLLRFRILDQEEAVEARQQVSEARAAAVSV